MTVKKTDTGTVKPSDTDFRRTFQQDQQFYQRHPEVREEIVYALKSGRATFVEFSRPYEQRSNRISTCPVCLTDLSKGDVVTGVQIHSEDWSVYTSHLHCVGMDSAAEDKC